MDDVTATLYDLLVRHTGTLNSLERSWFVRSRHVVAYRELLKLARDVMSRLRDQQLLDDQYAEIEAWRAQLEAAREEARQCRAVRTGLEKRVVRLEESVARSEQAADESVDKRQRMEALHDRACKELDALVKSYEEMQGKLATALAGEESARRALHSLEEELKVVRFDLASEHLLNRDYRTKLDAVAVYARQVQAVIDNYHWGHPEEKTHADDDKPGEETPGEEGVPLPAEEEGVLFDVGSQ